MALRSYLQFMSAWAVICYVRGWIQVLLHNVQIPISVQDTQSKEGVQYSTVQRIARMGPCEVSSLST